jgi:cobalt-zinc-cadmium efflux system outer membrane protein
MRWMWVTMLFAVSGCRAFYADVDADIDQRAAQSIDVAPRLERLPDASDTPKPGSLGAPLADSELQTATHVQAVEQPDKKQPTILQRLEFKEGILKFKVPDLVLPAGEKEREAAIQKQFPPLPVPPPLPDAKTGPDGGALSLADLQQIALRTNPLIRQAHQDIQIARGQALQAGLYPNPVVGYEGTTIGQGNNSGERSPGQQGGYVEQTIITGGKLTFARNAARREIEIAEQKLKAVETDVMTQVRTHYFAVLSARENFRVTRGMTELTDELYNVLLLQMRVGEVAAYEPMQIRVLAMQARTQLVQSYYRYVAAWKQLAASMGTPTMALTALDGQIDMPVPHLDQDRVLAYVLDNHSDVVAAALGVEKARLQARLAEAQPCPDIIVRAALQKDYTTPPFGQVGNVNVGIPIPFWNRNQGGILSARAAWEKAIQEQGRVNNDLTAKVAEAFQRYENNRVILEMYKKQMLPNQVQAFRAAVARHAAAGDKNVSYNDIVTVQQALAGLIGSYLNALNDQWIAVVDIGNLTQTRDLFGNHPVDAVEPIPEVEHLFRPRLLHRR